MFRSLFLKISLSVGTVVTLVLGIFAYFLIENQKEHLLQAKIKEVETLATVARNSLILSMREGQRLEVHQFPDLLGAEQGLLELSLFDSGGKLLRSSGKTEGLARLSLPLDQIPPAKTPLVLEREVVGRPFLISLQSLHNGEACQSCHGKERNVLGILQVSLSMESTWKGISLNRNLLIISTALTLLLMAMAINLLLNHLVKKPVGQLSQSMAKVEKGDLNVVVNLETRDELGRLAESFTSMVQKLSQAQKDLERHQRQQMMQVKYLASLGELAASVSHEIKNPLAGIKLAIQVLAREPQMADSQRETISEIMRAVERLDKTMADLLSYSRLRVPDLHPVSLPEVLEDALSSIQEECQRAGVKVEKHFDPFLPPLYLDSQQMGRVFLNLFLNALQAMPRGGSLILRAKRQESGYHLQEGAAASGGSGREESRVEVTVTDTGEGIPPEIIGEIFRPFFTTKAKGTGLGLPLAQQIVEQHHGQLFAQSKVGVGTTFYLILPVSPPA
jgi:signal transduction histidine kinase